MSERFYPEHSSRPVEQLRVEPPPGIYPCSECGKPRTRDEGGTVFTVCDSCWDAHLAVRATLMGRKHA